MFDLSEFGLSDTFEVSAAVPELANDAADLRTATGRLVRYFYDSVVDKATGERSLALVQCFATQRFGRLPEDLQAVVVTASPAQTPHPRQLCLILLSSAGDEQVVSDERIVRESAAVAVPSEAARAVAPVVAHVVDRLAAGHQTDAVLRKADRGYGVGYVADARTADVLSGWSGVVVAYGIRSVLTATARVTTDLFVTLVLHAKTPIPERTAYAFTAVSAALKLAVLPHVTDRLVEDGDAVETLAQTTAERQREALLSAQNETLWELLRVRHEIASEQSVELERTLELAERRASQLAASQAALAGSEARGSAILEAALDAVVVMDAAGRVVEWNPAAEATFGYTRQEAVGRPVAELIVPDDLRARHIRGIENYLATGEGPLLGRRVEITAMRRSGRQFPVELTIVPVHSTDGRPMFTGFVRDITERREQRAALLESRERFAHIARTLQRSLLPTALPQITGLDLGAVYHPSRAGSDVGGDFYDVFRIGRTDVMLTLGDVCGKGPEAATITAIARNTVRAVAPDLRHPTAILRRLNSVLRDQDIGERFCSIVAARAVPIVHGVRLSVCCAGHDQPIVVRASGELERIGVPGDLLGLFRDVRLFEETVQLSGGDTLVLFTDGVTEARRHGEQFGEHRLAGALLEARRQSATEMVNHALDEVLAFGGEQSRDDIAMLAIRVTER